VLHGVADGLADGGVEGGASGLVEAAGGEEPAGELRGAVERGVRAGEGEAGLMVEEQPLLGGAGERALRDGQQLA